MTNNFISLSNITKQYSDGMGIRKVLNGLSLNVANGDFIAITGESGSGKTTLLSVIGTLIKPDEGTYLLDGKAIDYSMDALAEIRNKQIGMVFQDYRLLPQLSAIQNICLPLLATHSSVPRDAVERAMQLMEMMGISTLADRGVDCLSGGEKSRVAICRALINSPMLLLADEPTGQLDDVNAKQVADLFRMLNTELHTSIIMVTHSAEMASVANRQYRLVNGKLKTIEN
jgi:ABC-type lipoprotein export system ATPase subunit